MDELEVGAKIRDRYILKELQGRGGFGEVWLAYDEILESDVAVKLYISLDSQGIEEFKSEYTTAQELHHPNLLTPSYLDIWQHRPFLVMKYCAKGSSAKYVGKMDEYMLWQFIHDVAAGLGHLHNLPEPIVHQDIKPYNILVDDNDRFLITDFGISKKIRSTMRKQSSRATGAGATAYMGPERFEANPEPIMASDIWSLGASIYEIATGELPFSGFGGGMQKNGAEIPSLDNMWSKEMNMVMQSCLAKETWDRPTARQLEEYSDAILKGHPAKLTWKAPAGYAPPVNVVEEQVEKKPKSELEPEQPKKPKSRKGWKIAGIVLGVAAVIAGVVALIVTRTPKITKVSVTGKIDGYEYVDLGLSVKWATCNVGASSPSDYGKYYAWGETTTKFEFTESNSVTYNKQMGSIAGDPQYDAATANWGGSWRMPTYNEIGELIDKCTWKWVEMDGHKGYEVTGPNGNSIFLPAAGWRDGSSLYDVGKDGDYWEATPHEVNLSFACGFDFDKGDFSRSWIVRCIGLPVRPVSGQSNAQTQQPVDSGVTTTPTETSTPSTGTTTPQPKKDDKAETLRKALADGNYQQVQVLANQGYAPAYGPLAKYYLSNKEYSLAEEYAKKSKNAGYRDGTEVLEALKNLGYYD